MTFDEFFRAATGYGPYPFQSRFAEAAELPHLLRAPTGAGKTATAVLGWLWRLFRSGKPTPRRMAYCLPMRVLVEQSEREATGWIKRLLDARAIDREVQVHVLMGGVETEDWHLDPAAPALLIGTQDMLLSRALNRGYAASRFQWPIEFGLLNNDCLWVFDEPQLMANGVATSAQLHAFRKKLAVFGACPSVWMSATLEPAWLDTVDFEGQFPAPPHELHADDYAKPPLHQRMTASKTLSPIAGEAENDGKLLAGEAWKRHQPGTQTLVIVNTVDRAKAVYDKLEKLRKKSPTPDLLLVHSRFRPQERAKLNEELQRKDARDRIIVATQVVEAGVDISCRTLLTELCPWASMVQRMGRCNRTGNDGPGEVIWLDIQGKMSHPYEESDLAFARGHLVKLEGGDVSPKALDDFKRQEGFTLPFVHRHVLRRRDLLDLFDTAPDLSGNDIDVSRYVRSDDKDRDVQVYWRVVGNPLGEDELQPVRDELCTVPVEQFRAFLKDRDVVGYVWDHLDDGWVTIDAKRLRPGMTVMLPADAGGYSETLGWTSDSREIVAPCRPMVGKLNEGAPSDLHAASPAKLTVREHTDNVCGRVNAFLAELPLPAWRDALVAAARWHDAGKSHAVFQGDIEKKLGLRGLNPDLSPEQLWAKSGKRGRLRYDRPHFRHELASALAALQQGVPFAVAYLVGSHHGRSRLSIRSLPGEVPPEDPETLFALGVRQGDKLPAVDLGGGVHSAVVELDLSPMRLGGDGSWTARALALLAELGPFRLAYLEALLRAADLSASKEEARGHA